MWLLRYVPLARILLFAGFVSFATTALADGDLGAGSRPRRAPQPSAEPVIAPVWGANIGLGMAFGGEPPDGGGLNAGDGVVLTLGTTFTPGWMGRVGFGLGLDFGIKHSSRQSLSGGFDLVRYPIVPTAHMLVRIDGGFFLRASAGPYIELGIKASRGGVQRAGIAPSEHTFPNAVGAIGEAGILYTLGKAGAYVGVRYTILSYETPSTTDASSFGLFLSLSYFFL